MLLLYCVDRRNGVKHSVLCWMEACWWLINALRKFLYLCWPSELALDDSDPEPRWVLTDGVPMFFLLILVEALFARKGAYRLHELLTCVSLGSLQYVGQATLNTAFELACQAVGLSLEVSAYRWVWENARVFEIDAKSQPVFCYVCLLLGKDLGYYLAHRSMHEFHLLWVGHSVHHSGEDYHLGTGLRQGISQPFFGWPFYVPLALIGFPPHAFIAHAQLNTLYQFWVHTDLIERLPFPLEYVLNSPMAHRMHHRPPGNCNYAGMLIIWDRLFGTYCAETIRKDLYGLAPQPLTFDPLAINISHARRILSSGSARQLVFGRRVPGRWRASVRAIFTPVPPLRADERAKGPGRRKWDGEPGAPPPGVLLNVWLVIALLASVAFSLRLMVAGRAMHPVRAVVAGIAASAAFACIGRVCDRRQPQAQAALAWSVPALASLAACVLL